MKRIEVPEAVAELLADGSPRILAPEESRDLNSVSRRLGQARAEADRWVAGARLRFRAARDEGLRQGRDEGLRLTVAQLAPTDAAVAAACARLEDRIVDLALAVARHLVGTIGVDRRIAAAACHALVCAETDEGTCLRVAPDRADGVRLALSGSGAVRIDVAGDEALADGQAVLDTAVGTIDLDLDRQLDILREALQRPEERADGA